MTTSPATAVDLHKGFRAFVEASQRLETSYQTLKGRAEAIDLELRSTNIALEQALGEKETILGALPVGVLATNQEGAIVSGNPEGARLQEKAKAAEVDLIGLDEGEHETGDFCVVVKRAQLPDQGTLFVVEDRSNLVHLSREVDRLDRLAGLSELALGIAHEIKNPLNGVMGFATLLERSNEPDEIRRYAKKIYQGMAQVNGIVCEMLAFARSPSSGSGTVPLGAVVEQAATAAAVPQSCITLAEGANAQVEGTALVRVLANLFRNSAEAVATDETHDDRVAVHVAATTTDTSVEILIRDNGPGVAAELGQRVLEPFVSSKDRGHGLGLALAARVMTFLGGSLELVNSGERGATFLVTLPITKSGKGSDGEAN